MIEEIVKTVLIFFQKFRAVFALFFDVEVEQNNV